MHLRLHPGPTRSLAGHVAVGLVLAAAGILESGYGGPEAAPSVLGVLTSVTVGLSVLLAWWSPFGAITLLAASVAVPPLLTNLPPTGGTQLIALMLLVANAAYRLERRTGLAGYAVAAVVPAVTIVRAGESVWEFVFFVLVLGPAWLVGALLRRERERSAELLRLTEELRAERRRHAEVAVAAERTRISRELHDAVAHTVSVMTLQVGVVRRRLQDGSVEQTTLHGAEALGRQAVDELRRIVGLVRGDEPAVLAPLPSLDSLTELVERVRSTGTTVHLQIDGDPDSVPPSLGTSVFRIAQEALTNGLRHAPGGAIEVTVSVTAEEVALCVVNGPAQAPAPPGGSGVPGGHGLPGMRERAHAMGGTLSAEPEGDEFAVRARLPLHAAMPSGRS